MRKKSRRFYIMVAAAAVALTFCVTPFVLLHTTNLSSHQEDKHPIHLVHDQHHNRNRTPKKNKQPPQPLRVIPSDQANLHSNNNNDKNNNNLKDNNDAPIRIEQQTTTQNHPVPKQKNNYDHQEEARNDSENNNHSNNNDLDASSSQSSLQQSSSSSSSSCALCFFGLPRSFKLLVLPSIIQNILKPNQKYHCDIFVHFFDVSQEIHGRSGYGGNISSHDIYLLKHAVHNMSSHSSQQPYHDYQPIVSFTSDTNEAFWAKRGDVLRKYRTTKGPDGKYLYFPWMAKSYSYPTSIDNIVKQWHSIQSVWEDMIQHSNNNNNNNKQYTRVAMLRNDVVYVTPFDIYQISNQTKDVNNQFVSVPNWARFPINDRMIYGSAKGVKIWATERFERLEDHVRTYQEPGYGMHSERFLNHSIFPAIRAQGIGVRVNPEICFFRARADGSTWINDCTTRDGAAKGFRKMSLDNVQALVENIIGGRPCRRSKMNARTIQIHCGDVVVENSNNNNNNNTTSTT